MAPWPHGHTAPWPWHRTTSARHHRQTAPAPASPPTGAISTIENGGFKAIDGNCKHQTKGFNMI